MAIACAFIVLYLFVKGIGSVSWDFLTTDPRAGDTSRGIIGGILTPLVGSIILITGGTLIAFPIGVATAIFLSEYRKPAWLAMVVENAMEVLFGVPSVVLGLFGIAVFTNPEFILLSNKVSSSGKATGQSFLVASAIMSLVALPLITRSAQEAMASVSQIQREASYALGKARFSTIRRIVLPAARPGIVTGTILGIGRIAGDTAIIFLILGGSMTMGSGNSWASPSHWLDTAKDGGSTLTSYTYFASPVGEGNAADNAYGAAFVLIVLVLAINAAVAFVGRRARTEG